MVEEMLRVGKERNRVVSLFLVMVTAYLLLHGLQVCEATTSSINVTIENDGTVIVIIEGTTEAGLNIINLPIEPLEASIEVYLNDTLIPALYVNNSIVIPSNTSSNFKITYIANTSVLPNDRLSFNVLTNDTIELVLKPQVILFTIPENIISTRVSDSNIIIDFRGPTTIIYGIVVRTTTITTTTTPPLTTTITTTTTTTTPPATTTVTTTTTTTPPMTTTTLTTSTPQTTTPTTTTPITTSASVTTTPKTTPPPPSQTTKTEIPTGYPIPLPILIGIGVAIVAIAIVIGIVKARSGGSSTYMMSSLLDDLDRSILRKIKESGGSILQNELYRFFSNVPKATFWRHVKKLERLGFINVVKEGRTNRLILKKRI